MDVRTQRIIDTAIELAERDGYGAVRLRDVAAQADVALGTVYRRFSSKEDILVAALEQEIQRLSQELAAKPPTGDTALERLDEFFRIGTERLLDKPNLARALLRAVASGDEGVAERVASFHSVMTDMIIAALHPGDPESATEDENVAAFVLQQVFFTSLVGWSGGLHDEDSVTSQVIIAAELMLRGIEGAQ